MSNRRLMTFVLPLLTLCCAIGTQVVGEDVATQEEQPLSAPVKMLPAPPPPTDDMEMIAPGRPENKPTTPAESCRSISWGI